MTAVAETPSASYDLARWGAPLFLFALAAGIRVVNLDRAPDYDELYHILAARGFLLDGAPTIADGLYTRGQLFTMLVAGVFGVFGENLVVARLLAAVPSALLVVAVFLWTRSVAGARSAWLAALLLCVSSLSIQLAQFVRFYALHGLAFWLGAIGVYAIAESRSPPWRTLALAAGSAGCLLIAVHLQPLTLIGIVGLALWFTAAVVVPIVWRYRRSPWLAAAGGAILVALAVLAAWLPLENLLTPLLERYRNVPLHAAEYRNQFWFYHLLLLKRYPTLWSVFPLFALFAVAFRPRPAWFCLTVFAVVVALLSFAGMKSQRYIVFVMPFLFVVLGIGLAYIWDGLVRTTRTALHESLPGAGLAVRLAVLAVIALFLIGANGAWTKTALELAGIDMRARDDGITLEGRQQAADWVAARPYLQDAIAPAPVVVTTKDLFALYYFDRSDIALSPNLASELSGGEFAIDPRTGRPVISTAASLERVLDCHPAGVLLADTYDWELYFESNEEMTRLLQRRMEPIELPVATAVRPYRWRAPDGPPPADCPALPTLGRGA